MSLLVKFIRIKFLLTPRLIANKKIIKEADLTLKLHEILGYEKANSSMKTPKMLGVDEDMREWNYYQILEHNTIVNHKIKEAVLHLSGLGPEPDPNFSIKHDVMPQETAGQEQVKLFQDSVDNYLTAIKKIKNLRSGKTSKHKIFGDFDAHKWHCMFGFHLEIHRKQAEALTKLVTSLAD